MIFYNYFMKIIFISQKIYCTVLYLSNGKMHSLHLPFQPNNCDAMSISCKVRRVNCYLVLVAL